jgi:hypothetical protein
LILIWCLTTWMRQLSRLLSCKKWHHRQHQPRLPKAHHSPVEPLQWLIRLVVVAATLVLVLLLGRVNRASALRHRHQQELCRNDEGEALAEADGAYDQSNAVGSLR